jgi:hypothetical protein
MPYILIFCLLLSGCVSEQQQKQDRQNDFDLFFKCGVRGC